MTIAQPMMIVNIRPGLPERGHIKIGRRGEMRKGVSGNDFQLPVKLDHFLITTMERGPDKNFLPDTGLMRAIAERTGEPETRLTKIPVRLLYDDVTLNFPTRYAAYLGATLWCSGDGANAQRRAPDVNQIAYVGRDCPCERIERGFKPKDKSDPACKINGVLSVLIDGVAGVGGVWKFRTTSFNSTLGLLGALAYIRAVTGGKLANLPLVLSVSPKQVSTPDGQPQTVYVVGLEFPGTVDQLRQAGYEIAMREKQTELRMDNIEAEARRLLASPDATPGFPGEDHDSLAEFYPAQAAVTAPIAETGAAEHAEASLVPQSEQVEPSPSNDAGNEHGSEAAAPFFITAADLTPPPEWTPTAVDPPFATPEQVKALEKYATPEQRKALIDSFKLASLADLYEQQAGEAITLFREKWKALRAKQKHGAKP